MAADGFNNKSTDRLFTKGEFLTVQEIIGPLDVVHRLHEMGLHAGIKIQILRTLAFGTVTVIQYGQTMLALNSEEMSCIRGR